jgi:EpsI family protein
MSRFGSIARLLVVVMLLGIAAVVVHGRQRYERIPKGEGLSSFPTQIGEWTGKENPITDARVLELLGSGVFLSRFYVSPTQPPMDLFLAYYPSQRASDGLHTPKNCLPGAGWFFESVTAAQIEVPGRKPLDVNKVVISKGNLRQLVLYFYYAHGRAVRSEYSAKVYLALDAIRMNRTDGGSVRVITPMMEGEQVATAEQRAIRFAQMVAPHLSRYMPD